MFIQFCRTQTQGSSGLQVSYVKGYGKLAADGKVEVKQEDGSTTTLSAKNTIIATGSCVTPLPGLEIDEERCAPDCNFPTPVSCTGAALDAAWPAQFIRASGSVQPCRMRQQVFLLASRILVAG